MPARPPLLPALLLIALALAGCFAATARAADPPAPPIRLKVLGGLDQISQYVRYEAPFWTETLPKLTGGRLVAEIAPFDRSGVRGQELLQLVRLGVTPFATVLLTLAAGDEPELNGIDLPLLNPDFAALRATMEAWRPRLAGLLQDRYGVRLLAIYAYPAQVLFCDGAFAQATDIAGRRVRVSSVGQAELMRALGATPIILPFAEIVAGMRAGLFDCAVTGTLSGNAIGLHRITTHVSHAAISWGVSVAVANEAVWQDLPMALRETLQRGLAGLEAQILAAADQETEAGIACNAGRPGCVGGRPGSMAVVEDAPDAAAARREMLRRVVLPAWIERCGAECASAWNATVGPQLGIAAGPP
jgi:TRAP-type C4-dicarboxylate transport system substrate-binding protein